MIEEKPEGIGADENRSRFDGVGGRTPYGDDWKDREKNEKKSDKKAGKRRQIATTIRDGCRALYRPPEGWRRGLSRLGRKT